MAHLQFVDYSIREYLLFRGFHSSLKAFEADLKTVEKGFSVEKIMERISQCISTQDLASLRELWRNLSTFFFSKLDQVYGSAVKRIEANLLKLFLVTAHTANKPDKINEFFMKCPELQSQPEWKDWFGKRGEAIPYTVHLITTHTFPLQCFHTANRRRSTRSIVFTLRSSGRTLS